MIIKGNIIDKKIAQAIIEERLNKESWILSKTDNIKDKCKNIIRSINDELNLSYNNSEVEQLKQINVSVNNLIKTAEEIEENHRKIYKVVDNEMDRLRESQEEIIVNEIIEESSQLIDKRIIMFAEVSAIMKKTKPFNTMSLSLAPEKDKWMIVNQSNYKVRFKGTPEEIYKIITEFK